MTYFGTSRKTESAEEWCTRPMPPVLRSPGGMVVSPHRNSAESVEGFGIRQPVSAILNPVHCTASNCELSESIHETRRPRIPRAPPPRPRIPLPTRYEDRKRSGLLNSARLMPPAPRSVPWDIVSPRSPVEEGQDDRASLFRTPPRVCRALNPWAGSALLAPQPVQGVVVRLRMQEWSGPCLTDGQGPVVFPFDTSGALPYHEGACACGP